MNFYRLYHGDSREVIPTLESDSVDMIITDPPYGFNRFKTDTDECVELTREVLTQSQRVLKKGGFCFMFAPTNQTLIDMINVSPMKFNRLLWMYKPNDITYPWARFLLKSEALVVFTNGKGNFKNFSDKYYNDTFIHKQGKMPIKDHPTVKPLQVIKDIVSVSKEDAVIFDPFLGSGTTMYACQDLRRSCIGIELEEKYCNLIKKRCFGRRFLTHSVSYDFIPYETFI